MLRIPSLFAYRVCFVCSHKLWYQSGNEALIPVELVTLPRRPADPVGVTKRVATTLVPEGDVVVQNGLPPHKKSKRVTDLVLNVTVCVAGLVVDPSSFHYMMASCSWDCVVLASPGNFWQEFCHNVAPS